MEGATTKPRTRKRQAKKQGASEVVAATPAPAHVAAGAGEGTEAEAEGELPQPSLSQRVARSLRQLGASSMAKGEEDGVEQVLPAAPEPEDAGRFTEDVGEAEEGKQEQAAGWPSRLAHKAVALGPQLRALVPGAPWSGSPWPAWVWASIVAALLLTGGMLAAQPGRASRRQLAVLEQRLAGEAQAGAAARRELLRRVEQVAGAVHQLDSRLSGYQSTMQDLQQRCGVQANASASLWADLALVRAEATRAGQVADAAAAAAAAAGSDASPAAAPGDGNAQEELVRGIARQESAWALELFAADRTGLPDYALAAGGAAVVAHSAAHQPANAGRIGSLRHLHGPPLHPLANKALLAPVAQPGACLPLVGAAGWVDVRLAQRIQPTAFTYEHIPVAIAFDIRSAPRNLTLLGFAGAPPALPPDAAAEQVAGQGLRLGSFSYEVRSGSAVQTFQLGPGAQQEAVDHVRLVASDNHGHPTFTCLYRLRVHGTVA